MPRRSAAVSRVLRHGFPPPSNPVESCALRAAAWRLQSSERDDFSADDSSRRQGRLTTVTCNPSTAGRMTLVGRNSHVSTDVSLTMAHRVINVWSVRQHTDRMNRRFTKSRTVLLCSSTLLRRCTGDSARTASLAQATAKTKARC